MDKYSEIIKYFEQYDDPYEKIGAMAHHIQILREENEQLKSEINYVISELRKINEKGDQNGTYKITN